MAELQLTGLQKRAAKYINSRVEYQIFPGERVTGDFIGFDKNSPDRAILQLSNAADRIRVPLMYVVNYFENGEEAREEGY